MKGSAKRWVLALAIVAVIVLAAIVFLDRQGSTDIVIAESVDRIGVTSTAFEEMGAIPDRYTGNGEDISPDFKLEGISQEAVSIAIVMDDLDVPWKSNYTHWVIWNIPPQDTIPEAIAHGESVSLLEGAKQGIAFGRNRYRGPKPPFGTHRYQYHLFVLDSLLELESSAGKSDVLAAMEGHILQYGSITGWYPSVAD